MKYAIFVKEKVDANMNTLSIIQRLLNQIRVETHALKARLPTVVLR